MRVYALVVLLVLWSVGAAAEPSVARKSGPGFDIYTVSFDASTAETKLIQPGASCSVGVAYTGTGTVSLYQVATATTAAASGTLVGTFSASTTAPTTFKPGLPYLKAVASSTGTSGTVMTIRCSNVEVAGGSGNVDVDGNGLFEASYLVDADGDGSSYVTCTAKDTPDSACKVAGEVIYRDFSDDVNCMIHGCGSRSAVMEHGGTIFLRNGVYVNFSCWSPGGANDPTDPTTRDDTGDDAYSDCPDGEKGLPRSVLSLAGWGGTIVGVGRGQGRSDTTQLAARGYGRTDGTYIVNDMGNREDEWFLTGSNNHKSLAFGYPVQAASIAVQGTAAWFGSPGGWGTIDAVTSPQNVESLTTATICVCDSASCTRSDEVTATGSVEFDIQSITTDTDLLIEHDLNSDTTKIAMSVVRARSAPPYTQGSCASNYVGVPLGLTGGGTTGGGVLPGGIQEVIDGAGQLYILRDDYFASAAQVREVTIESQDWWNEAGGDCADTGTFSTGDTSTDADCDTLYLANIHGSIRRPALQDVDIRYWHNFAVDGEATPTVAAPMLERVSFFYGTGDSISDPGHGWRFKSIEVNDSQFSGLVVANFGIGRTIEDFVIRSSTFGYITQFANQRNEVWDKMRIENSQFRAAFSFDCGNENIRINDVYSTGRYAGSSVGGMLGLINLQCDDETQKSDFTFLSNLREDPPGSAVQTGGTYNDGGGQVLVRIRISDTDEADNLGHVFISDSSMYNQTVTAIGTPATNSVSEGCLVGIEDRTSAGGAGSDGLLGSDGTGGTGGELDTLRMVKLVGNMVKGDIFCEYASQGFWDVIASTSDSTLFDAHRTLMREMNFEF